MSELREEIQGYIDSLSDRKLEALKPLLTLLVLERPVVETDLTEGERAIIANGREEYKRGCFVPLESLTRSIADEG